MTTNGDRRRYKPIQSPSEPIVSEERRALALLAAVICAGAASPLVCGRCGRVEMSATPTPWGRDREHCTPYTSPECWAVRQIGSWRRLASVK